MAAAAAERKEEKGRWVLGILLYVSSGKSTEKTKKLIDMDQKEYWLWHTLSFWRRRSCRIGISDG